MADIKLKDQIGAERAYRGKKLIDVPLDGGGMATFYLPEGTEAISDLLVHDVRRKASAQVSDNSLIPANIRQGVSILGVDGSYAGVIPSGSVDITDTEETNVAGYAAARISAPERAKLIPANIRSGETVLGVPGGLKPAPDWTGDGESYDWTYAYFNTAFPWGSILPELDYDEGGAAWVGVIESGPDWADLSGWLFALDTGGGYVLFAYYDAGENDASVTVIYATRAGTATLPLDPPVSISFTEGWNTIALLMPQGGGKLIAGLQDADNSLAAAGTPVAFGNYIPAPAGTLNITANGDYDVTDKAAVHVAVPQPAPSGTLTITRNGTYTFAELSRYETVVINISSGGGNVTVEGNTLIFDDNSHVEGNTLVLDSDARVEGNTLIFE